jgi:uncharacterized protein Smg (DUF494 family)
MQNKILELIVYILNEMRLNKSINEIDQKQLHKDGYTEAEINSAFTWVISKVSTGEKIFDNKDPAASSGNSKRFLNYFENSILTPEASGYIIQMKEIGLLTNNEIELILDKIILAGFQKVSKEDLNYIISSLIFEAEIISNAQNILIVRNNETIH